nr:host cell division inhibitor Icd-like protein [Obesumbacterium proteus]
MANIYGVCPEIALQHKGYSDFVQHTNPLKEGLLRLVLNAPQTLQVTIGYLQNQAASMPLAYSSLKSFQNPNSGFATNVLKKFQTVNLQSAQTLRNSFGCVQIKLGETPSLKLKADNSLIGLISVREPELVNLLIQLNSVDSTESANSLIQINYREARESTNSLIMPNTCTSGTSPNVLMRFDSDNFPSRDDTQKAQKEKGSTANAAFLHNVDGDQSLSCLAILRWRRLISPLAAVTKKPAVLSPSSLTCSISSRSSSGSLTETCKDLLFFLPVAITGSHCGRWCSVCTKNYSIQSLTWCSPENILVVFTLLLSWCTISEAQLDGNPVWASIHNVIGANTMAFTHSTQTRPKFTYLFLGTPSDLPTCTPTVLRAEADTEAEARAKFIDWDLTFAAQIRTVAPSRLQLFSTDDGFMWIYEQRQEASHA